MNAELLAGRKSDFRVWGRGQLFWRPGRSRLPGAGVEAPGGSCLEVGPSPPGCTFPLPVAACPEPAGQAKESGTTQSPEGHAHRRHVPDTWAPSPLPRLSARPPGPSPHRRTARAALQLLSTRSRRHWPARVPTTEPSFQECGHSVRHTEAPN